MLPTEEQIRTAAYRRWERRGRGNGYDVADWLGSEQDLMIALNYTQIAYYNLDEPTKQYVGSDVDRRCRYCGRGKATTDFKDIAHALPEAIGNRSLIALDECDECNKFFSETIEDSFGKLFR